MGSQVDPQRNLLYVKGQVPGHKGNYVYIKDAVYKIPAQQPDLPWPTAKTDPNAPVTVVSPHPKDPFEE